VSTKYFQELLQSVRQAGKIKRGEMQASRRFVINEPDVSSVRHKDDLSPNEVGRDK
jgi:hypothetical protein